MRTATSRARVESRPPEMPTTRLDVCVACSRCARPLICMFIISSQRVSMSLPWDGTNGSGLIYLSKSEPWAEVSIDTVDCLKIDVAESLALESLNDIMCILSRRKASMSISAIAYDEQRVHRGASASKDPFSYTRAFPSNTRSVVDSPNPADAYT